MPLGTRFSQQEGQVHNGVVVDKKIAGTAGVSIVFAPGAFKLYDLT